MITSSEIPTRAGQTQEKWIEFREIHRAGITQIDTITFDYVTLKTDTNFSPEPITFQINEEVHPVDRSGDVVFEGNGITVVSLGKGQDGQFAYPKLLLINNTGRNVMVEWMNLTPNGQLTEYFTVSTLEIDEVFLFTPEYLVPDEFPSLDSFGFNLIVSDADDGSDAFYFETEMLEVLFQ